ncbi:MAG: VCBS repeat-containing protein [Gemmatimonadetes bacterium]|nr:VCBS repeat-containing protein [Gemmatimonadota bacterium]
MIRCRLTITSPLPSDWGRIPFSPVIDFGRLIAQAGVQGVLDPNSIVVVFVQYMHDDGQPRVRAAGSVLLEDGRPIDDSIVGRQKHWTESFRACDWDGDGLIDLIYNLAGTGEIYLLRNVGSPQEPVFATPRQFKCYGTPIACTIHGPSAWAGDLNGDGKPDLLACVEWSVYPFFAHAALEMDRHPQYRIELMA